MYENGLKYGILIRDSQGIKSIFQKVSMKSYLGSKKKNPTHTVSLVCDSLNFSRFMATTLAVLISVHSHLLSFFVSDLFHYFSFTLSSIHYFTGTVVSFVLDYDFAALTLA